MEPSSSPSLITKVLTVLAVAGLLAVVIVWPFGSPDGATPEVISEPPPPEPVKVEPTPDGRIQGATVSFAQPQGSSEVEIAGDASGEQISLEMADGGSLVIATSLASGPNALSDVLAFYPEARRAKRVPAADGKGWMFSSSGAGERIRVIALESRGQLITVQLSGGSARERHQMKRLARSIRVPDSIFD